MKRRDFLTKAAVLGAGVVVSDLSRTRADPPNMGAPGEPDVTLRIGSVSVELGPGQIVSTVGYNGRSPGPILRMREGRPVLVEVINDTVTPELVHWHGQFVSSEVDGSSEEGTPVVPAHGRRRYNFTPRPAGTRWYHTHVFAGKNLDRSTYTGQFGFLVVEPASHPGRYDQEVFLALKDWQPFLTSDEEEEEEEGRIGGAQFEAAALRLPAPGQKKKEEGKKANGMEIGYKHFSVNDRALGHGEPVRVKSGQRVLFHILNASATEIRRVALPGHQFKVLAMDGNPVPAQVLVDALQLAPAERVDCVVEMNSPGVWIFGTTHDDDRQAGMGIVVEYANRQGNPAWSAPPKKHWDYTIFGKPGPAPVPDHTFEMLFRKVPGGKGGLNRWTINGKSFPHTDPLMVSQGKRYRLKFNNQSDDAHPLHLHRHTFELTRFLGKHTSGLMKDTLVVPGFRQAEVDFVADNPGLTLFHCHQQMHMDFGFMTLVKYT